MMHGTMNLKISDFLYSAVSETPVNVHQSIWHNIPERALMVNDEFTNPEFLRCQDKYAL
jgi:hypothetical protein